MHGNTPEAIDDCLEKAEVYAKEHNLEIAGIAFVDDVAKKFPSLHNAKIIGFLIVLFRDKFLG
jgi:hypothetical protein